MVKSEMVGLAVRTAKPEEWFEGPWMRAKEQLADVVGDEESVWVSQKKRRSKEEKRGDKGGMKMEEGG